MAIEAWLQATTKKLATTGIASARLDSEVLLAHILGVDRSWLVAHSDDEVDSKTANEFERLIDRRLNREPVAYLVGYKEFYGRAFIVTPDTLVPRPETEDLIDLAKQICSGSDLEQIDAIDVGCGSGCIGLTLKLEIPAIHSITLADISPKALVTARKNAEKLSVTVEIVQSDLLSTFTKIQNPKSKIHFDLIVANLPYIDRTWQRSPETDHEPALALFAEDNGLELIKKLIDQSINILKPGGYLLLEADPEQHTAIIEYAATHRFHHVATTGYALALQLS